MDSEAEVLSRRLLSVTEASFQRRAQLEQALASRVVIEQAKGILAERFGISIDAAFAILRSAARAERTKIHALAREVVDSPKSPPAIARAADGRSRTV